MDKREGKRRRERFYLEHFLRLMGIKPQGIECDESPDCLVGIDGKRLGIEVTEFHSSARGTGGYSRRLIEQEWEKLQAMIMFEIGKDKNQATQAKTIDSASRRLL